MKKLIPYIAFACLTGFTAISDLPVMAGGCNSHMNKKAEIKCAKNDTECQTEKTEKFELNKTLSSQKLYQFSLIINFAPRDLLEFISCLAIGQKVRSIKFIY